MSFSGNIPKVTQHLNETVNDEQLVIIQTKKQTISNVNQTDQLILQINMPIDFLRSIYHLATSRYVFVDNYYGFLAVTNFKEEVQCIQLWHANGALKRFGLEDLTNGDRTNKAMRRFQAVYDRFDTIVVGSNNMENIFKRSFGIKDDARFLRTGIPRTDFFFDDIQKQRALQQFKTDFPIAKNKKAILYAPTYRENQLNKDSIKLNMNLSKMYKDLKDEYVLFLRLHPAIKQAFNDEFPDFVINVSEYESINTLMVGADILITDYSSVPFEFSLLQKPMIFYAYDLETYAATRGLTSDYENIIPGPIVRTTDQIIEIIKEDNFDLNQVKQFANEWNEYSKGDATEQLIYALYDVSETKKEAIREHV